MCRVVVGASLLSVGFHRNLQPLVSRSVSSNILKLRKQEREQATSSTDQNGVTATREHEIVAERSWYSPPNGLLTSSRTQVSSRVSPTSDSDTPLKDTETHVLATHVPNSPCIIASRERIRKWRV